MVQEIAKEPNVENVNAYAGGQQNVSNNARMFMTLKPLGERRATSNEVIASLRRRLSKIAGVTVYLQPVQDIRVGGRPSASLYQYTMQGNDIRQLQEWSLRLLDEMRQLPSVVDVNNRSASGRRQVTVNIDRVKSAQLGITQTQINQTLYSAFGQRQVATIFSPTNQYRVVLELENSMLQTPDSLKHIYIHNAPARKCHSPALLSLALILDRSPSLTQRNFHR